MLELKSALEEDLSTRLGLDRPPTHEELVAKVQAAGLLDETHVASLTRLLAHLSRIEALLLMRRRGSVERVRDADVLAVAARVHELLAAVGQGGPVIHSRELP
jgi:hypothetical protein